MHIQYSFSTPSVWNDLTLSELQNSDITRQHFKSCLNISRQRFKSCLKLWLFERACMPTRNSELLIKRRYINLRFDCLLA